MRNKIFFITLALFLILISLISAIPPQAPRPELGYEIRIPQAEFLMEGRSVHPHIHIFNVSTGTPIYPSNSDVGCILHLYNQTGSHVLEETMGEDDNGLEWELFIDGGNLTQIGFMSFIIYCNDSLAGGFVSNSFEITGTGFEFSQQRATLSLGLIGVLIFLFIITLGGISKLPSKDNYEEGVLISINQLKYLRPVLWVVAWFIIIAIVFTGSNIAFAYMGSTLLADILFRIFQIMFALSLPMVVVWFCYLFYKMFRDREMKKYLDRGWE